MLLVGHQNCQYKELPPPPSTLSALGLAAGLEGLLAEVGLDLLLEHQHAQVGVGGLVHGLGLDAHAVLLGGQLVHTPLLVPQVEQARHGGACHDQVAPQVLPVQVHVLHAPALHIQVETPWETKWKPLESMGNTDV